MAILRKRFTKKKKFVVKKFFFIKYDEKRFCYASITNIITTEHIMSSLVFINSIRTSCSVVKNQISTIKAGLKMIRETQMK